ncbi:peroxiredoxin [Komagataeibacter rhaeticus]|nr:peroxiredoxin [Komagataeibacter rhaeticus]
MIATPTGPISFHAWHRGSWRIVLTHPGITPPTACAWPCRRYAAAEQGFTCWACPLPAAGTGSGNCALSRHAVAERAGAVVSIIQDDTGHVRTLWRGTAVDAGPEDAMTDAHAVFIVDPVNTIRSTIIYPVTATGRDFDEILRVLSALDTGHPTLDHARRAA